jgi:hypothetical protein
MYVLLKIMQIKTQLKYWNVKCKPTKKLSRNILQY